MCRSRGSRSCELSGLAVLCAIQAISRGSHVCCHAVGGVLGTGMRLYEDALTARGDDGQAVGEMSVSIDGGMNYAGARC